MSQEKVQEGTDINYLASINPKLCKKHKPSKAVKGRRRPSQAVKNRRRHMTKLTAQVVGGPLIGWESFLKYLKNQIFPRYAIFSKRWKTFCWINLEKFRVIQWLVYEKNTKNHIFTKFWYFSHFFRRTRFFPKNRAPSHFSYYDPLTSCQISERSYV